MTDDGRDSFDQQSFPTEDGSEKYSRRGRLKDALNRTKTQIQHRVQEERGKRKEKKSQPNQNPRPADNVDDFLAAGRGSFASSQRPSLASTQRPSIDDSSTHYTSSVGSPRPSTSDSKSQPSPRRGPPISVPRIDVSASTRFPNARTVDPDDVLLTHPPSSSVSGGSQPSNSLLRPDYRDRSQSASCLASGKRRARTRGLSVGFAAAPPTIIGEGGDEAYAPPVEISRAKARARSASPQGRRPYGNSNGQSEARIHLPGRGISDNSADLFVPKPISRTQTGASLDSMTPGKPRVVSDDDFVPKPFARQQTGRLNSDSQSPDQRALSSSQQSQSRGFGTLTPVDSGKMDLTKEFEMTLGLTAHAGASAANTSLPPGKGPQIVAPRPQRAPPSYDKIEHSTKEQPEPADTAGPRGRPPAQITGQPPVSQQRPSQEPVVRRPVPAAQLTTQNASRPSPQPQVDTLLQSFPKEQLRGSPIRPAEARSQPNSQSSKQEYYPPPPQRQPTYVIRNIKNLEPVRARQGPQSRDTAPDDGQPLVTEERGVVPTDGNYDNHQSFAGQEQFVDHAGRSGTGKYSSSQETGTIRHIPDENFEASPSEYTGSFGNAPASGTAAMPTKRRFYEDINKGGAPEGFI